MKGFGNETTITKIDVMIKIYETVCPECFERAKQMKKHYNEMVNLSLTNISHNDRGHKI